MSANGAARRGGACADCLSRSQLLAELIVPLDYCARDPARLLAVLALDGDALLAALGGRRRQELAARVREHEAQDAAVARARDAGSGRAAAVCRHDDRYPPRLRSPEAPHLLYASAGAERLQELTAAPVVAVAGSTRASDYGAETARSLARGLAACGVTIATVMERGIGASARQGAAEVCGAQLSVAVAGLDGLLALDAQPLARAIGSCMLAELPCATPGRTFGRISAQRTLVALADVVLCVEARASARELLTARIALAWGRSLGAVPGRVSSPGAGGPNALLRGGAALVRGVEDVLELLPAGCERPPRSPNARDRALPAALDARLGGVLERVAGGQDTAARLCERETDPGAILLALSELELLGLLGRGEAGRYVPRCDDALGAMSGNHADRDELKEPLPRADE